MKSVPPLLEVSRAVHSALRVVRCAVHYLPGIIAPINSICRRPSVSLHYSDWDRCSIWLQEKIRRSFAQRVASQLEKASKTLKGIRDFDVTLFQSAAAAYVEESQQAALGFCYRTFGVGDKHAKRLYDAVRAAYESAMSTVLETRDKQHREQVGGQNSNSILYALYGLSSHTCNTYCTCLIPVCELTIE